MCAGKRKQERLPPRRPRLSRGPERARWQQRSSVQGSIIGLIGENMQTTTLWPLAVYSGAVIALVTSRLALPYVLGQRHQGNATGEPYESGIVSTRFRTLALIHRVLPSRHTPGWVGNISGVLRPRPGLSCTIPITASASSSPICRTLECSSPLERWHGHGAFAGLARWTCAAEPCGVTPGS